MPTVLAFKKIATEVNEELKLLKYNKRLLPLELVKIFKEFSGRCAYCGVPCVPGGPAAETKAYFQWYIPLKRGGAPDKENLIIVCGLHKIRYNPSKKIRETIPDINTFADLIHVLVQSVVTTERLKSDNNVEAFRWEEKIRRIKREINSLLEDIAVSLQYKPFTDWKVDKMGVYEEEVNTIPDLINNIAVKEIAGETVSKEDLLQATKQLLTTKQYKIVRK